ncbi:hypothetical protein A3Q56_04347 [Intoshia linei]|uniref:Lipocalin/cytosolic fatty-acid binding domain-containing protein n=1 Tax=Intoshia linei TaxID=1819745 RepID=A0A177B0X6_9BILA|nr:hypothetical protein A3Q56_04347 [Intoshia linei]
MTNLIKLNGTWNLCESEFFEEYMKDLKIGFLFRKASSNLKPIQVIDLTESGGCIETKSTFKNMKIEFDYGVEFTEKLPDGTKFLTTITYQDGKLFQKQIGQVDSKITREYQNEDTMKMILESPNVTCTRIYKRKI